MIDNYRTILLVTILLTFSLSSCITDDSSEGGVQMPVITVEGSDAETMPVYNFYLGDEAVIEPDITYSGTDPLTYHWQIGTYVNGSKGTLEDAGDEAVLHHTFTSGGSYYAHLSVTDGKVGKVAEYQININRTFEEGYLLSATDKDGSGNLTFLKILTPEEKAQGISEVVMEHAMERMNEDASEQGLLGTVIATDTYPVDVTRLIVSTKDRCYFLNPNELTIISSSGYGEIYPGFSATKFYADNQTPFVYDGAMKKFVHINVKNQFTFEYSYFVNLMPEDIVQSRYKYYNSVYYKRLFLDYTNSTVAVFNAYGRDTYFPNTGDMLRGHTLITAFTQSSSYSPWFILTRYGDKLYLWKNTSYNGMSESDFTTQELAYSSEIAIPERGTWTVGSPTYQRVFYAIGNHIYVFLPNSTTFALPTLDQYAIEAPAGEVVTCIETNFDTEELYVATYNASTGRGSFYVYNCADVRTGNGSAIQPTSSWKNCTGYVNGILYKPSIQ